MAITATQIQNLYIAYFGRPAEQAGLDYWSAQADLTVEGLSASFAQQPEYQAVYGDLPREEVVAQLYQNLFGRKAEGNELDYWIASDDIGVDRMALALVNGAQSTDRELLDGKTEFAAAITAAQSDASDIASVKQAFNDTTTTISFQGTTYTLAEFAREVGPVSQFYQLAATELNTSGPAKPSTPAPSLPSAPAPTPTPTPTPLPVDKYVYAVNGDKGLQDGTGKAVTSAIYPLGTTAATIKLNDASFAQITIDDTSTLSSLTLEGTLVNNPISYMTITEDGYFDSVNELALDVSSSNSVVSNISFYDMNALSTIDASRSTASLALDVNTLSNLSKITVGSGNDILYVAQGSQGLVVDAGAGDDKVVVYDAYEINAARQQAVTVTLGSGHDEFSVLTLSNITQSFVLDAANGIENANASIIKSLVKVTDFSSDDKLTLGSDSFGSMFAPLSAGGKFVFQTETLQKDINAAATLAEALQLAANNAASDGSLARSTAFQYQGNTYIFLDHALSGNVTAGDGLIELTDYLGKLDADNFSFVADVDNPQYSFVGNRPLQDAEGREVTKLRYHAGVLESSIGLHEISGPKYFSINDASTLTKLTLSGTSDKEGALLTMAESSQTDNLSTLKLAISGGKMSVSLLDLSALAHIDASDSSADLTIEALTPGSLSNLATVIAGSGNDLLILGAYQGISQTGAAPAYASGLSVTLGDGADTLKLQSLGNLVGSFAVDDSTEIKTANAALQKSLIKVTDFSAEDKLDVASVYGLKNATFSQQTADQQNAVSKADTLGEALQLAANNAAGSDAAVHSTLFQYGGNTYLFVDHSAELEVAPGDGLIELTGFTGTLDNQHLIIAA